MVSDAGKLFVFSIELSDDCISVSFKLGVSFVVVSVMLDFGGGSEVHQVDRCSQSEEGGSIGLEELLTPVGHSVDLL